MIGDFVLLSRVKRKLIEGTMGPVQVFLYFLMITAFDGLQLVILQITPATPTRFTPLAAWGSAIIGLSFIILYFVINGGSRGVNFLERYFSLCGVVGLWCIVPFQCLLACASMVKPLAGLDWYIPAVILVTNLLLFGTVALQFRDVAAGDSQLQVVVSS